MEENDSFCERVISDVMNALSRTPAIDEFDIIPGASVTNRSPVVVVDTKLALEHWAVPYVYKYGCRSALDLRDDFRNVSGLGCCGMASIAITPQRKSSIQQSNRLQFPSEPEALCRATSVALLINPGLTTMWNIRKNLIIAGYLDEEQEMDFTALVLTRKQKTAQAFFQRQFIWKRWQSRDEWKLTRLEKDLCVTAKAADRYPNNYHAWNHRNWVVNLVLEEFLLRSELDFSLSWMKTHVSDHSGVQYREMLLSRLKTLLPNEFHLSVTRDLELNGELIHDYPGHEALWNFRRFLILQTKLFASVDDLKASERNFCAAFVSGDQKRYADRHGLWLERFL